MRLPHSSTMAADSDEVVQNARRVGSCSCSGRATTDPAATTTDAQGFRKRDRGRDGCRRIDECGLAFAGDRSCGRGSS